MKLQGRCESDLGEVESGKRNEYDQTTLNAS